MNLGRSFTENVQRILMSSIEDGHTHNFVFSWLLGEEIVLFESSVCAISTATFFSTRKAFLALLCLYVSSFTPDIAVWHSVRRLAGWLTA